MKIAIDVMGGDNSPAANIDGVFEYINTLDDSSTHFSLVGDQLLIKKYLENKNLYSNRVSIINADFFWCACFFKQIWNKKLYPIFYYWTFFMVFYTRIRNSCNYFRCIISNGYTS